MEQTKRDGNNCGCQSNDMLLVDDFARTGPQAIGAEYLHAVSTSEPQNMQTLPKENPP